MNTPPILSANDVCKSGPAKSHFRPFLVRAFVTVLCITLLVFLIFLSSGRIKLSQSGIEIAGSFVYSTAIGFPSMVLLTWISHRYSARHPRLIVLAQAMVLICMAIIGSLIGGFVLQLVGLVPRGAYWAEFRGAFPFSVVITLLIGLSLSTFETLSYKFQAATLELRTRQVEQERANKLLAEARLSSLESRIHPHFLFNTLNSIAALIPSDPVRAERTVGSLASLLRFSLNANHGGLVPLHQELKVVGDYLEIEKTRFGARLRYELCIPNALLQARIPPLALQSLVENAVKHVVSQRPEGASIEIAGSGDSTRVCIVVFDDGPGFMLDAITPDHGLGNLLARMELLYGAAGQLEVARENGKTAVRLSFPA